MSSMNCQRAIADAIRTGNALLKIISPNNAGQTGGHECGYYLPKGPWEMYTSIPPEKGVVRESPVEIVWPDGRVTDSRVKWYGAKTRSEYRLTRFGPDFPWLKPDCVGNLLVLVIESHRHFRAHVLESEEDIEEITATLNVDILRGWAVYRSGEAEVETEKECIERLFSSFAEALSEFPSGDEISSYTLESLIACIRRFESLPADDMLMHCLRSEFRLFRVVEHRLRFALAKGPFASIDEFVRAAHTILQSRKSRAGRSLENHIDYLLTKAGIPHDVRPAIEGFPDVVIPGKREYENLLFPADRLCVVGIKTTCKDRWRQLLNEAPRVPRKHLLTTQPSISRKQLESMRDANLTLVVPSSIQHAYPKDSGIQMLTIDEFVRDLKTRFV